MDAAVTTERHQQTLNVLSGADTQVSEELVWELFTQAGPVGRSLSVLFHIDAHDMFSRAPCGTGDWRAVNVYMPKDRVTNQHQGYGFVEFKGEEDADYVSGSAGVWA